MFSVHFQLLSLSQLLHRRHSFPSYLDLVLVITLLLRTIQHLLSYKQRPVHPLSSATKNPFQKSHIHPFLSFDQYHVVDIKTSFAPVSAPSIQSWPTRRLSFHPQCRRFTFEKQSSVSHSLISIFCLPVFGKRLEESHNIIITYRVSSVPASITDVELPSTHFKISPFPLFWPWHLPSPD